MNPLLHRPEFPRSNRYDSEWIIAGSLGPHPLWLAEWLATALEPEPGMRVLDLGCGKALTSVFLAREFDVHVYAVDLWTPVDDNWKRVVEAGEARRVTPVHAEAHALPSPQASSMRSSVWTPINISVPICSSCTTSAVSCAQAGCWVSRCRGSCGRFPTGGYPPISWSLRATARFFGKTNA